MNNDPNNNNPFEDIPTSAEALEAEVIELRKVSGVPVEVEAYLNSVFPDEEDLTTVSKIAAESGGNLDLAKLLTELEWLGRKENHPTNKGKDIQAEKQVLYDKIEELKKQTTQNPNTG